MVETATMDLEKTEEVRGLLDGAVDTPMGPTGSKPTLAPAGTLDKITHYLNLGR